MYVEQLELVDFRAISQANLAFAWPGHARVQDLELPNINLLVGTNGGGKSTVLKAIVAAVMAEEIDLDDATGGSVLGWPRIGGHHTCTSRVDLRWPTDPSSSHGEAAVGDARAIAQLTITRDGELQPQRLQSGLEDSRRPPRRLFAYGSFRRAGLEASSVPAEDTGARVASLLAEGTHQIAPEHWLPGIAQDKGLLTWLNGLMPPDTALTGELHGEWVEIESRDLPVPRIFLSDGAQSYLAWLLDLVYRLYVESGFQDPRAIPATVLVDEVDQRMHPAWQQRLLRQLSEGFPKVQFICTAHSPLLAGGLRPENLAVLEPDPDASGDGAMIARALDEDLYGRTADGVLTSSYFSLPNSRAQSFGHDLRNLAEQARMSDQAALDFTRLLAAGGRGDAQERREILERHPRFRGRRS